MDGKRMAPIGSGIPALNGQTRLIGLKLDTLGAVLPPATRKALGGDGLDSAMMRFVSKAHWMHPS